MNLKLLLGVIIPVILIIVIAILGSSNSGLIVNEETISSLKVGDIFTDKYNNGYSNSLSNSIRVGKVSIDNNYFLSRRYEFPAKVACLVDSQQEKPNVVAGYIHYSEGVLVDDSGYNSLYGGYYNSYGYSQSVSIELDANEKKVINFFLVPDYAFTYKNSSELIKEYSGYDKVIIVEESQGYDYCGQLTSEQLSSAKEIKIVMN